jgi:2-polyprenyl-3-methyl-5-hydroxy-6-metoxy-1,4-benzoquinol methylase
MYNNPLNKLIWDKVSEMFFWNIAPESPIAQLPFTQEFIYVCEEEFSMTVRDTHHPISLGTIDQWVDKTMLDFVKEIDNQYQYNYFIGENGTSTTGVVGEILDVNNIPIANKWNIRGNALVTRLQAMQELNPDLTILDMGCGVNEYKNHLTNVTGVDPYRIEADILSKQSDFDPQGQTWDVIICFGPMNWYTYDEQFRNMAKLKECLAPAGLLLWSHNHNYYKIFQPDAAHAHTWIHGELTDAHRNSAFFFSDRDWKYTWYFNNTEHSMNTLAKHVGLKVTNLKYDECNLYRPPMWRLFAEMTHE